MIQFRREVTYLLTTEAKEASERVCNSTSKKPRSFCHTYWLEVAPGKPLFAVNGIYHSLRSDNLWLRMSTAVSPVSKGTTER